ncbi:MAG: YicC/YloC family endoribonuclease [Terriglobia bacterium]
MLRSMTGFAQASGAEGDWTLRVRVKALNHRFLDLRLRVPEELEAFEPRLRALVRRKVHRGHLDLQFQVENSARPALEVNQPFLRSFLALYRDLQREHGLSGEPDLTAVLRLPGVLRNRASDPEAETVGPLGVLAERLLSEVLERLDEMRRAEGAALEDALRERLARVRAAQGELTRLSANAGPSFHRRLKERLEELLGQSQIDPGRLAQEAAYLADRSDLQEELTRLASHSQQFAQLLATDGTVGKRLDFLLQEMNRETNTILAKVPGAEGEGLEMIRLGLEIKAQIEQLREQVQNVE